VCCMEGVVVKGKRWLFFKKVLIVGFLPVIVLVWLVGWSLYCFGGGKKHD